MTPSEFLNLATGIAIPVMIVSLLFPMFRLFRGPSLPDRVVALDQMELVIIAIILAFTIKTGNTTFIDVVLITSFLLALGAMIITRYLYKREKNND